MKKWVAAMLLLALLCSAAMGEELRYQDGVYRGFYYQNGMEQVAVQFELKDGVFKSVVLRNLKNSEGSFMTEEASDWQKNALVLFSALCTHLVGRNVSAIDDLYAPEKILEELGMEPSAHVLKHSPKLISALWDALNRRPFKLVNTSKLPEAEPYPDGAYTGTYSDDDGEQVVLDFSLRDGCIEEIHYRKLCYKEIDYLSADAPDAVKKTAGQFQQLIDYLVGKALAAVNDLYLPGNIASDTDVSSAATLRAPKVVSAIWEGLNKNAYTID